jgi:hypothetical protein
VTSSRSGRIKIVKAADSKTSSQANPTADSDTSSRACVTADIVTGTNGLPNIARRNVTCKCHRQMSLTVPVVSSGEASRFSLPYFFWNVVNALSSFAVSVDMLLTVAFVFLSGVISCNYLKARSESQLQHHMRRQLQHSQHHAQQ